MSEIVCNSTRFGSGCGHPIDDHDLGEDRACDCCSGRHNEDPSPSARAAVKALFPTPRHTYHGAWAEVSGYVAEMVSEGSDDAAQILRLMHELKPTTAMFTGRVDDLITGREKP